MAAPGATLERAAPAGGWARLHARDGLLADAGAMFAGTALNGALGFLFWLVAARLYPPAAVGLAGAAISALFFLGNLGRLGLDVALARALPGMAPAARRAGLAGAGLGLSLLAGGLAALGFLAQPVFADAARAPLGRNPALALGFALLCGGWSLGLVLEQLLLVRGRGPLVLAKNAAFSLVRLAALPLFALQAAGSNGILAATGAGVAAGLLAAGLPLRGSLAGAWQHLGPSLAALPRLLGRDALGNYAAMLVAGLPNWLLPLLVADRLGAVAAGHFYTAWMVATLLNTVPSALAMGFFAAGARAGGAGPGLVRRAYGYALAVMLPAASGLVLAAGWLLPVFGAGYAAAGTPLLRWLLLAAVPYTVVQLAATQLRLAGRLRALGLAAGALAVLAIGGSALALPALGLAGAGLAWLGACVVAGGLSLAAVRRAA